MTPLSTAGDASVQASDGASGIGQSGFRIVAADRPDLPPQPPLGEGWHGLRAVLADELAIIGIRVENRNEQPSPWST